MGEISNRISKLLLQPATAKWLLVAEITLTIALAMWLPRLRFQFELEELFAANSNEFEFYQDHVAIFGFDNDYLNLMVIPDGNSIYDWRFLSTLKETIASLEALEEVDFVYSPFALKKVIKGATGLQTYPLLQSEDKLKWDSLYMAKDPYLSQAFPDAHVFIILIKHRHFIDANRSAAFMEQIRPLIAALPYDYHLTGRLPAEKEFLGYIQSDFAVFLALSLVICALVLWYISRNLKLVLFPFLVSVLSLAWTFGFMGLAGIPITIMTSLLPPIILFVACSDTIHLISAFQHSQDARQAIQKVLGPTFLTSLTTAIGFLSLTWVPIGLIRDMGWIAAISVVFALLITYGVAPWFLRSGPGSQPTGSNLQWVLQWTRKNQSLITVVFLVISAMGLWACLQLKVNAYLLHDMPPDSRTVKSFTFADEQLGGSKPWEMAIWPRDTTMSIWDELIQQEISEIVSYLENTYPVANIQAPSKFMQYARYIRNGHFDVAGVSGQDRILARRLERSASIRLVSNEADMARINGNIPEFGSRLTDEKNAALHAYMAREIDLDLIGYRITGTNHLIDQSHNLLAGSMVSSLGLAVLLVSLLFGFYFRSLKWAFVALIPNVIPLLITGLLLYWLDVPIQLSTSIIFVLVFGIVVDDTIHFLATFKRSPKGSPEEKLRYTMETSGRGMLNTTLTLVAGFCLFLFSGFGGTYYLGFFICIALIAALITDWLLLPVILRKLKP